MRPCNLLTGWTPRGYAGVRILVGAYLLAHFIGLAPWVVELFSTSGMLKDGSASPLFTLPNLLWLSDSPAAVRLLNASGAFAALAFIFGVRDKWAAAWMWLVLAAFLVRNPLISNPALPYLGWMLLAHLFIPSASLSQQSSPRQTTREWRMPAAVIAATWVVLALSYSYSGYTKLLSPTWMSGDAVAVVLENPLARDWWVTQLVASMPQWLLRALTWFILWVELLYAPLFLLRRSRFWLWASMLFVQIGFLALLKFPDLTIPMLLMHLLACEPRWFASQGASLRLRRGYSAASDRSSMPGPRSRWRTDLATRASRQP